MDNYLTEWIGLSENQVIHILSLLGFQKVLISNMFQKDDILVIINVQKEFGKQYVHLQAQKNDIIKLSRMPYYASQISQLITFEN